MTTRAENELLTQTDADTPMGRLFRQYWIPATLSERLPEPECTPVPLKLLGERLVAFRDADGTAHLIGEFCPHRRASLAYARCEDGGLRCIFHGWLIDGDGRVQQAPPERHPERFAPTVEHTAYPTYEAGGLIWTFMGEGEPPAPPNFVFTGLEPNHVYATHYLQDCNFLQGIEADVDLVHSCYLHSSFATVTTAAVEGLNVAEVLARDGAPLPHTADARWGFWNVWEYEADPDRRMLWIHPFLFPCFTVVAPSRADGTYLFHAWVPIDDEHHMFYFIHYNVEHALEGERLRELIAMFGHDKILKDADYRCVGNLANRHLQDRTMMRDVNYSGIAGIAAQDIAVLQSMQPIVDRTQEHLGSEDATVRWLRKRLIAAAQQFTETGNLPEDAAADGRDHVQGTIVLVRASSPWQEAVPEEPPVSVAR